MIHRTISAVQGPDSHPLSWQQSLSRLITDPVDLLARLDLKLPVDDSVRAALQSFPLRVTESFVNRMERGNPEDPLLLQVLPLGLEMQDWTDWSADPLAERSFCKSQGLIHKYQGRVLLIAAPQCAINCRYCFRRHFDYAGNSPGRQEWQTAFDYIRADASIEEVILSGGDPLVLSDKQIAWLVEQLANIEHVKRLRIHSRLPIVLPSRITPELLAILSSGRLQCVMVVHSNHPNEIDNEVSVCLKNFRKFNITALNQSVLLKNINDRCEIFTKLSIRLFDSDVLPYYLHLLDKVKGARHFSVPREEARALYNNMRAALPGYLVPQLVEEIPGAHSKSIVM